MKNYIILLLAIFAFSFISCGGSDSNNKETEKAKENAEEKE